MHFGSVSFVLLPVSVSLIGSCSLVKCGVNRNIIVTWLGWLPMNLAAALKISAGEHVL